MVSMKRKLGHKKRAVKRSAHKKTKVVAKLTPSVKNAVKRIVNGTEETKRVSEAIASAATFNSTISIPGDWYRCIPSLAQSSVPTSYSREGRLIDNCHIKVHWNFRYGVADANTRDIFVYLIVVQPKFQKASRRTDVNNQISFYNAAFLDDGLGTMTSYDGSWLNAKFPINKPQFTLLHKRIFRLSKASGSSNGAGVVGQYDGFGRGMYAIGHKDNISHNWSHKLPNLKYSDGIYDSVTNPDVQCLLPSNAMPCWGVGYYYADGTPADTAGGILNVSCWTEMTFKDS